MAKVMLSWGMLNIPVKTSPAARGEKISFNQITPCCRARTKQPTKCSVCDEEQERKALLKGYEYEKGEYILVTDEELDACKPESDQVMKITSSVKASEVDPMLFESSFYLSPEKPGMAAYVLLVEALSQTGRYAIAAITMNGREQVAIIRPYDGWLAFHTMYYESEVRETPAVNVDGIRVKPQELALAKQLVEQSAEEFDHSAYSDGYLRAVQELLDAKQQGKSPAITPKKKAKTDTLDLMAALSASIEPKPATGEKSKPAASKKQRKIA